jgi:hypothetical protein
VDVAKRQTSDGHTGSGGSSGRAVLVVLLDDNTVLGDARQSDVFVGDAGDGAGGTRDGLDANTVLGVGNGAGRDGYSLDDVIVTATDRADRETVATRAGSAGEGDTCARVDGETIILVLNVGAADDDVG